MKRELFCDAWTFCGDGIERQTITLPHDAMQVQGRSAESPTGSGGAFYLGGCYVYEKRFCVPEEWRRQTVFLEFEGVYPKAQVFLNEEMIGECKYGYSLFRVELKNLEYGKENTVRVEVDNTELPNSRWYSGAGIYRPVWLLKGNKQYIKPDGVRVTTQSIDPAEIQVDVAYSSKKETEIRTEIFYYGQRIAEGKGSSARIKIPDAHLWSAEEPELYECVVTLYEQGEIVDTQCTTFGIRTIAWSKNGFFVNGKNVLLKGGCIHHDNGILGSKSYRESEWRRIQRLKEFGFNAIRSSHNPLCHDALEACDRLGMYVMDETWDMWDKSKTQGDYAKDFSGNYEKDLHSIVEKDYNHPSVIMYSIGNEVTEPVKKEGLQLAEEIVRKLKMADNTRPVTAGINLTLLLMAAKERTLSDDKGKSKIPSTEGMNSTTYNKMISEMGNRMTLRAATEEADHISTPVFDLLDIAGYNYAVSRYEQEGEIHPDRVVVGSETYTYDLAKTWQLVEKHPYLIGDFMWTAWDYLGEAGIGSWSYDMETLGFQKTYPWLLADTGAFDILGNDNAAAGAASVVWGACKNPYIAVRPVNHPGVEPVKAIWRGTNAMPYWSYKNCDGNKACVEVYSSAEEVELFLNGKSVGKEKLSDFKAEFQILYEPGELKAVAYDKTGEYHSESSLKSADSKVGICIRQERSISENPDIVYLDISLRGENGEVECNQDTKLSVSVTGGELLAFGSANPRTEEKYLEGSYTTYYGRSQAIIKVLGNQAIVSVSGEGLEKAEKVIDIARDMEA